MYTDKMAKGAAFDKKVTSFYKVFCNELGSCDFSFFQTWAALQPMQRSPTCFPPHLTQI